MTLKKVSSMNLFRCLALAAAFAIGNLSAQIIVAEPPAGFGSDAQVMPSNDGGAAVNPQLQQAKDNVDAQLLEDNYDLNRLIVDVELYIWNRVADLLDIVRCGIGGGIGVGAELSLTDYATLGASAIKYQRGVDFPHCVPPLWLINYYDKAPVLHYHETTPTYYTAAFGPWRTENVNATEKLDYIYPRDKWDVRAQIHAFVLSAYVNVSGRQVGDFFAGLIGLDPTNDDDKVDPYAVRQPADQFGRGICNIAFGALEIPFNILRVTEQEGDLPGISKGVGLGVWRFLCREVVGVVELLTFPFGWTPIIEPEYVFQKKRGVVWQVNRPTFNKIYRD